MKFSVWAVLAVVVAGLYGLDRSLAGLESREVSSQAHHAYKQGVQELERGRVREALDLLTRAHALDRENRAYLLALARAQGKDGRMDDAQTSLGQLLTADSNDADANLEMARLLTANKQYGEAYSFYHRALFGNRMKDPVGVRLELARLLEKQGQHRELLAELLLLQSPAERDPELARAVAGMFLSAAAPDRAAQMYRSLLRMNPDDQRAEIGLGEVELQQGEYRLALALFAKARDTANERLAGTLAAIDPTLRRLSSAEKYSRSAKVLEMTAAACGQEIDVPKAKKPTNEDAEALLDKASSLWKQGGCNAQPGDAASLIHKRISQ